MKRLAKQLKVTEEELFERVFQHVMQRFDMMWSTVPRCCEYRQRFGVGWWVHSAGAGLVAWWWRFGCARKGKGNGGGYVPFPGEWVCVCSMPIDAGARVSPTIGVGTIRASRSWTFRSPRFPGPVVAPPCSGLLVECPRLPLFGPTVRSRLRVVPMVVPRLERELVPVVPRWYPALLDPRSGFHRFVLKVWLFPPSPVVSPQNPSPKPRPWSGRTFSLSQRVNMCDWMAFSSRIPNAEMAKAIELLAGFLCTQLTWRNGENSSGHSPGPGGP